MVRILLILVLSLTTAVSATQTKIVYEGRPPSTKINSSQLPADISKTEDSIEVMLGACGYLNAKVTLQDQQIVINAGPQFTLDTLVISGDTTYRTTPAIPFVAEQVNAYLENILDLERNKGYLYASLTVDSISKHAAGVNVIASLIRGPLMRLAGLEFSGLKRTDPTLLRKYLPVDSGAPLTQDRLDNLESEASAVPFVTFQPPARIEPLPGYTGASVKLDFVEPRQVNIEGGGGYLPGNKSVVVWNLKLDFKNPFGGGRNFNVLSEKRETRRQLLDVGYDQPIFLLGRGTLGGSVSTRDYRDQFYEFAASAGYETALSPDFTAGLKLSGRSVEPATNEPSYSSYTAAFSIARTTLRRNLNPRSGFSGRWNIGFDFRSYSTDSLGQQQTQSSFNEVRNEINADYYRPLAQSFLIHFGLGYRGLETAQQLPPLSELYFVGGPGTVRGFRNEQYTAVRTGFGSVEPRYRFETGYLFLFYDGAYISNRIADSAGSVNTHVDYINGYGFGVAVVNSLRSIKLSLGWNPDIPFDQPQFSIEISSSI
ncbi:MAG TPA: BamA/TamA family outer membrane protein [candidate division Zixibacteria bacterium]|nr:BamA/TamA family outer membrane protein [candidate division Zixibacteria bacterium]